MTNFTINNRASMLLRIFGLIVAVLFSWPASAQDYFTDGEFKFKVTGDDECEVTGTTLQAGDLVIPSSATAEDKTYKVTAIAQKAFYECEKITGKLVIPEGVKTIGDQAFYGCKGLTGDLRIPNSVEIIGEQAFNSCSGLTGSLTLGNSLREIGRQSIPTSLTGTLELPNSLEFIGEGAFENCQFNGQLNIPQHVKTIGDNAFSNCKGFTGDIIIPNSVETIGGGAFAFCYGFNGNLIIGDGVTTIGTAAFGRCRELVGTLTLGKNIITINGSAFYGCPLQGELVIPDKVKYIGVGAFEETRFSGTLIIPGSVEEIDQSAFFNTRFTGLVLEKGITKIGYCAFNLCTIKGSLTIPDGIKTIARLAFSECKLDGTLTIGEGLVTIPDHGFCSNSGLKNLILPASLKRIPGHSFYNIPFKKILCRSLTPPELPDGSLSVFDSRCFEGDLYVPEESLEIYKNTAPWNRFSNIYTVESFTIDCTGIELDHSELTITAGSSASLVASVEPDDATDSSVTWSSDDINIVTVDNSGTIKALKKGTATVTATTVNNLKATCKVTVMPYGATIDGIIYELALPGIENTVTVTGGDPDDQGVLNIAGKVTIDGKEYNVTEIAPNAFREREDITKLIIPEEILVIGDRAFWYCSKLVEVVAEDRKRMDAYVRDEILEFGENVFSGAPITTLYLGRDTSGKPFGYTTSLKDLTFSETVTTINSGDFEFCWVESVKSLGNNPPVLAADAFPDMYSNCTLYVPDGRVEAYKSAEVWKNFFDILGINEIRPTGITIEPAELEIAIGDIVMLKAIITPENATDQSVTWKSSNDAITPVSLTGGLIGTSDGTVTITATTCNGLEATCIVTVVDKDPGNNPDIPGGDPDDPDDPDNPDDPSAIGSVSDDGQTGVRVDGNRIIAPEGALVYDITGRRVMDLASVRPGIYIVRIADGKSVKIRVN